MRGLHSRLLRSWGCSSELVVRPPASEDDLRSLEDRVGLLPKALRAYLSVANGFSDQGLEQDENGYKFWPCERMEFAPHTSLLIFADYLDWSWAYAIQLKGMGRGAVFMVGTEDGVPYRVASSFDDFLSKYLDDDDALYGPPEYADGRDTDQTRPTSAILFTLFVTNIGRSVDFYVDALGLFTVEQDSGGSDEHRTVRLALDGHPGCCLNLHMNCEDRAQHEANEAPEFPLFSLVVEDCHALVQRLERRGVAVEAMYDLPYGTQVKIRDPSGHPLMLIESEESVSR